MSLQLRRGTDAERLTITPVVGEVIYVTDTKKVWAGDGATVGGVEVGSTAPVDSVAGKTGAVTLVKTDITDFVETDYATGAEGDLASTAVQPADNISTLTNDSGFISGYTVTEGDVTAHQAALSLTESQISDLGAYITGITGESIKNLSDVFSSMAPTNGQVLTYDTTNGWQAESQAAIPSAFTDLTDTVAYTGAALQVVRVNATETALEYVAAATPTLPTTTKGDMIAFSTVDARLAVGTDGQILTADSVSAEGVKWADAAGGGGIDWGVYGGTVTTAPVATGEDSIAIGDQATAGTTISGVAIGKNTRILGSSNECVVIGTDAYINTLVATKSVVIGKSANNLGGVEAVAIGSGARNSNPSSFAVAVGRDSITYGINAVAVGRSAAARADSVTLGTQNHNPSGASASVMIGQYNDAYGAKSIAIGYDATVYASGCIAIGDTAGCTSYPNGTNSVYIGAKVVGANSTEIKIGTGTTNQFTYYEGKFSLLNSTDAQFVVPPYTTAARPASPTTGSHVFDTTLGKPIWYSGANWVDATGATV